MRIALAILVLLAACTRPLTDREAGFAATLFAPDIDVARIRIHDGAFIGRLRQSRPARPRVACRERIFPPPKGETVQVGTAAFVLYNTVFLARDIYTDDTLPTWPDRVYLPGAMLMGHEFTHVWQWQNREVTGYTPARSANEHRYSPDPYLFELENDARFLDYGFEQQGGIMEEFICCAAPDPRGARTERLRALLSPHFDLGPIEAHLRAAEIVLPWEGARTKGICSDS